MKNRARAVIVKNGKVLAIERHENGDHFWCFPGGGVKEGENETKALERECLEEANVRVKVGTKIWKQDFKGENINFYLCEIVEGRVGKGDGPEYQNGNDYSGTHQPVWLPIKDLEKYDLRPKDLRDKIFETQPPKEAEEL